MGGPRAQARHRSTIRLSICPACKSPQLSTPHAMPVLQENVQTGGKPVGRRLRYSYEVCLEMNAQLRHLPWPPVDIAKQEGPADAPADGVKDDTCEETSAQYDEEVQLGDCAYVTDPQSSDESGDACHESCRPVSHITDDTSVVDDIDMPEKGHTDSSLPKSGHGNS